MSQKLYFTLIFTLVFLFLDIYTWQGVRVVLRKASKKAIRIVQVIYWSIPVVIIGMAWAYNMGMSIYFTHFWRTFIFGGMMLMYLPKIVFSLFLLVDDARRLYIYLADRLKPKKKEPEKQEGGISRSKFIAQAGLITSAVPLALMTKGIISGAYDYRVRKVSVPIKNLPSGFEGIKIAQISDIHSGSFYNKTAVQGGVDMLLAEKPDMVFFTGDLVNSRSGEIRDYFNTFNQVKAPLGVYSVLGNHDYGDYSRWPSKEAKERNFRLMLEAHKRLGWDLLLNENRIIKIGNDELPVIGVQNWGSGRFSKYGDLAQAHQGTEDYKAKLLLSHDPSHWDAQVRPEFSDISIQFSGHTHGMQFGIEIGDFKWSPVKYRYPQWAGLYKEGDQYLYVNRGYGFIGYPGRVGILPEVTIVELNKA